MSQAGILNVIINNPEIPIEFPTNSGTAVAVNNSLSILGDAAQGVSTSAPGASNTILITVANATTSSKGVAQFNPANFSVTGGVVSLSGVGLVTSVSGTANRITSTGGSTPVIDIAANYVGQTSIITLGNITTGTWNGTTIAVNKGGTGLTSAAAFSLIAGGTLPTNNFQTVSSVATGQVLTSAGTAALPVWSASPSLTSVTVSGGTALSTFVQGNFTPTLLLGGAAVGISYNLQEGSYTQIGDMVYFGVYININTLGSSTGPITITGFPVNAGNSNGIFYTISISQTYQVTYSVLYSSIIGKFTGGTDILNLYQVGSGQDALQLSDANLSSLSTIAFSGFYKTS